MSIALMQTSNYIAGLAMRNGSKSEPFQLDEDFLAQYHGKKPAFGFNGLGEFVFYRTYSRKRPDGLKENALDCFARVVEGCYEIQRRYCESMHVPWGRHKAQKSAQEMFQRMWDFKFLPPGRGLWMMGTEFVWSRGSAALNNCGYASTAFIDQDPARPFAFMMDMTMLGVGVGFDTQGADKIAVRRPAPRQNIHHVGDSREGWTDSVALLIHSYTDRPELGEISFDYSQVRPAGSSINGFGGQASGPGILKKLHEMIRDHFERMLLRQSRYFTSVDIVDLMNYIGICVVAGNVRRSSQLVLGNANDADYISMKDYRKWPAENESHRWASNNSIFAEVGMDYQDHATQTALNGEPGYVWMDNIRNYGRMIDGRRPGIDGRVMGTNPCFSGRMRLLTADGYQSLRDLWAAGGYRQYGETQGELRIINRRGEVTATTVYRTSEKSEIYRVCLQNGTAIEATANHTFITLERRSVNARPVEFVEVRKPLSELRQGDLIPLNRTEHFADQYHHPVYALLAGWCIGDGSLSPKADGQVRAECTTYDSDIINVLPQIQTHLKSLYDTDNQSSNQEPAYEGWERDQPHFEHREMRVGSNVLGRMLREDGVVNGMKHQVPARIWRGTKATVAAFIKGLASADGGVQVSDAKGRISVRISQASREFLEQVRLLLSQFDIYASVRMRRAARRQLMNDGKGGKKFYRSRPLYELFVEGRKQVSKFLEQIGFIQEWKSELAQLWLKNHQGSNNSDTGRYVQVQSIEFIGEEETFCLTEPGDNQVVVEGIQIGQCAEQSLEDSELCCLVETFPAHHDTPEDFHRTLKFAYLYAKTVTLLPTHNKDTNAVLLRNRRIGLSQSGIAQALEKFGRRTLLERFCNDGYKTVCKWDTIYSDWLCVPASRKKTSVKPSGSVSLLAGASPGIHYGVAPGRSYWRNVRIANDSTLLTVMRSAGYHIEPDVRDNCTSVVRFGITANDIPTVKEVSIWEQVKNAVDYQYWWADNQVSCTIQFRPEEAKEIKKVLAAYDDQLKSISFLPIENHGYPQAPYMEATAEEVAQYNASLKTLDFSPYVNEAVGSKYCDNDSCVLT